MKNLGRIKLSQLSKAELEDREMKTLVGGCKQHCCCRNVQEYEYNMEANYKGGLHVANGGESYHELPYGTLLDEVVVYGQKPKP